MTVKITDENVTFWASSDYSGPGCDDCGATAETPEKWNARATASGSDEPLICKKCKEVSDRLHDALQQLVDWVKDGCSDEMRTYCMTEAQAALKNIGVAASGSDAVAAEAKALADEIEYCMRAGLDPSLSSKGWRAVIASLRASDAGATGREPVEGEALVDRIAQWLHDETEHPDSWPSHTWPLHEDDTGRRGSDAWVKIVPKDVVERFRDIARRWIARFPSPPHEPTP